MIDPGVGLRMSLRSSAWIAVTRLSLGAIAPFAVFASRFGRTVHPFPSAASQRLWHCRGHNNDYAIMDMIDVGSTDLS
jgi:hypothetical protein